LSAQTGGAKTQILRSDDAGKTWKALNGGLPAGHSHMTCGLAAHPNNHQALCVGYTDGTVYFTTNGGDNWRQLSIAEGKLYGVRLIATT
jgi:photosystem II stability/assembly factor-like uncharacterized protein